MKQILLSVVIIIGLGITKINAQSATGGLKLEANTSNFIISNMDSRNSKFGLGVTFGGFGIIEFTDNFAFRPELLLHYKNSITENKIGGDDADYQYFGIEIPLYAVAQFGMGNGMVFAGLGPYIGIGIDARYKTDRMPNAKLYDYSIMQRWDVGAGILFGYEFADKLQINSAYKIGFIDALDTGRNTATMLNQAISLGLAFRF